MKVEPPTLQKSQGVSVGHTLPEKTAVLKD